MTDPNGLVTSYEYDDPEDLLTAIVHPTLTGKDVDFTYDTYGRLSTKADKAGSYVWTYGDLDEVLTAATTYTGMSAKTVTYSYFLDGSRASLNLTGAGTVGYTYNGRGELTSQSEPYGTTASWTYLDNGLLHTQTLGNGAVSTYGYNALSQLTSLVNQDASSNTLSSFTPGNRDGLGNLLSVSTSIPGATTYQGTTSWTYDTRSRLTQETSARLGSYTHNYDYDAAGNTTKLRSTSVNRTYNSRNQITNTGHAFDTNGNPTTYRTYTATWDENDCMTGYGGLITMSYRSDGLRSQKGSGSSLRYFLYDGGTLLAEMNSFGSITAFNVWGTNGLVARRSGTSTIFYQFDNLGGTAHRLDASSNVLSNHMQDAFGQPTSSAASSDPYLGRGAQVGYYRDSETGLYLCTNRFYDPVNARFLNRDPIGYGGGMNIYAYCGSNPVGHLDPSGLDALWYDRLSAWSSGVVGKLKASMDVEGSNWIVNGINGTILDLNAAILHLPSAIGHLGEGLGAYAGNPNDPCAQIAAWGDVGLICGLALGGVEAMGAAGADSAVLEEVVAETRTYESLLPEAQAKYQKLAGKIHKHHVDPKYMGGAADGETVDIDAAYHQQITNEFRSSHGYGRGKLSPDKRAKIMNEVYKKYPLP
jgi:RHS repeat-associated protein